MPTKQLPTQLTREPSICHYKYRMVTEIVLHIGDAVRLCSQKILQTGPATNGISSPVATFICRVTDTAVKTQFDTSFFGPVGGKLAHFAPDRSSLASYLT